MKKKFLAMYALVGAMVASPVFTSCIDDTESASVTAVRTERAEAIKIANQIAAAKAELQIQRDKLSLEKDIVMYEQQMAQYEASLLSYQLQIKQNQAALDSYGVKTLSELTNAYTNALSNAATTEWNIVKYNQQIEALKGDFLGEQEYVKKETARLEAEIAACETQIAEIKKLQEAGLDKSSMDEKIEELRLAHELAKKELAELENKYGEDAANTVTGKAIDLLDELATSQVKYYQNNVEGNPVLVEAAVAAKQKSYANDLADEELALAQAIAKLGKEDDKIDTQYEKKTSVDAEAEKTSTEYANLAISNEYLKTLEKALADAEKALADNTDATKKETLEADVEAAEEAIEDFKKDSEGTETYEFTVGEGETAKTYTAKGLAYAEMNILKAKDAIVTAEVTLAEAKEDSEDFEAAIAAFAGEDYEAYLAAVAELDAAEKAEEASEAEYDALVELYNSFEEGVFLGQNFISVNGEEFYVQKTTAEKIEEIEAEIEGYKAEITELEAVIEYYENGNVDVDSEEMLAIVIAHIEKKIAIEETKLATYEKLAEEAKAALDAYLAE